MDITTDWCQAVSASNDGAIRRWDLGTGEPCGALNGHTATVTKLILTLDGRRLKSSSRDRISRVWKLTNGKTLALYPMDGDDQLVLTPDNQLAVHGGFTRWLYVWHLRSGMEVRQHRGHTGTVTALAIAPDGRHIVSGSDDKTIRIWDASHEEAIRIIPAHEAPVAALIVSPDGRWIVSAGKDCSVKVWDFESGRPFRSFHHAGEISAVLLTMDGRYLITGSQDATVRVWDIEAGTLLCCFRM